MKRLLIILFCCLVGGCVSAKYNPKTSEISYLRIGDQELGGVEIILPDGSSVAFEQQKSETEILQTLLQVIKQAYSAGLAVK